MLPGCAPKCKSFSLYPSIVVQDDVNVVTLLNPRRIYNSGESAEVLRCCLIGHQTDGAAKGTEFSQPLVVPVKAGFSGDRGAALCLPLGSPPG